MAAATVVTTNSSTFGKETSAGVFTDFAEVYDIDGPGIDRTMIDVSHMTSPNYSREFVPGFVDWGEVTVEIAYLPTAAVIIATITDLTTTDFSTLDTWRIIPAGTSGYTWTFKGYCKSFKQKLALDDVLKASMTIKLSGKPSVLPT